MKQVLLLITLMVIAAGCTTTVMPLPPTPTAAPPQVIIATPSYELLGTETNPIVIGYVIEKDPEKLEETVLNIENELSADSGLVVKSIVFSDYKKLYDSLKIGSVHAAWVHPLTYITAHRADLLDVLMLSNHFGFYQYGTQFLANVESGYRSYFDPATNKNTSDAITALKQLNTARPCYMEPGSLSGSILPQGILGSIDITTNYPSIIQSFTGIVRALYIKGVCDFGTVYSETGDVRTGSAVIGDLTDVTQRVVILWKSDPIIPNLAFAVTPKLDPTSREQLAKALTEMVVNETGKTMLTAVNNGYEIRDLRMVDDSIYDPLRVYLSHTSTRPEEWLGR
mgnify:CR=1 FL=1